jgi:hypothetical protein
MLLRQLQPLASQFFTLGNNNMADTQSYEVETTLNTAS